MARIYMSCLDVISTPEKGGGKTNVEFRQSISLNEMYKRLTLSGQVAIAKHVAGASNLPKLNADILLKNAHESPAYVRDGVKKRIEKSILTLEKNIADKKAKDQRDKLIATEAEKLIKEREGKVV